MQLLELVPNARVVVLAGGLIAWYNAGAPMEDPDGTPAVDLHPFTDELADFMLHLDEAEADAAAPPVPDEG